MRWVYVGLRTIHRVVGTGVALFVLLWFGSGAVLLYVPYPSLSEDERFEWLEPLRLDHCCVSLEVVWNQIGLTQAVEQVRLVMISARPVYVVHFLDGRVKSFWADQGELLSDSPQYDAASGRQGQEGRSLRRSSVGETLWDDQWTVSQRFDAHRPLRRIQLYDLNGTEWYLSSTTGELVLNTTAFERQWNTVGAVIHWLYLPMLRRHWALWDQTVWWVAAAGLLTAISGMILGVQYVLRGRGQGLQGQLSGIKGWHYLGGMALGVVVCLWRFSGLLSMDHGRWFSRSEPTMDQRQRFMGGPFCPHDLDIAFEEAFWLAKPETSVKEMLLTKVGGISYYVLRSDPRRQVVVSGGSAPAPTFSLNTLAEATKMVIPARQIDRRAIAQGDLYYYSTAHNLRPRSGLRIVMDDPVQTWVHIDMHTGQLLELLDYRGRLYRWLFHGLHNWDMPFFLEHDQERRIVLLGLCIAGFLFSLSSVYLGITVLVARVRTKPSVIR